MTKKSNWSYEKSKIRNKVDSLKNSLEGVTHSNKVLIINNTYFQIKEFQDLLKPEVRASASFSGFNANSVYYYSKTYGNMMIIPVENIGMLLLQLIDPKKIK